MPLSFASDVLLLLIVMVMHPTFSADLGVVGARRQPPRQIALAGACESVSRVLSNRALCA